MAKRRKVLTFYSWLNNLVLMWFWVVTSWFLYSKSVEKIVKSGTSSLTHGRMGRTKWQRERSANFEVSRRRPVFYV